jgi:hypothetical protein
MNFGAGSRLVRPCCSGEESIYIFRLYGRQLGSDAVLGVVEFRQSSSKAF